MTSIAQLTSHYHGLIALSQQMLLLARAGEWDELIQHEMRYVSSVQELAQSTAASVPSMQEQAQLRPLLQQLLTNEDEIKRLLQGRMQELSSMVAQHSRQKSVLNAYGQQGSVMLPSEKESDS